MIEPIFGQLEQVLGFRQFSLRGLASMRGERRLLCEVHNLLKLWRIVKDGSGGMIAPETPAKSAPSHQDSAVRDPDSIRGAPEGIKDGRPGK